MRTLKRILVSVVPALSAASVCNVANAESAQWSQPDHSQPVPPSSPQVSQQRVVWPPPVPVERSVDVAEPGFVGIRG